MHRLKVGLTFRFKPRNKNRRPGTTYTITHVSDNIVKYSWREDGILYIRQSTHTEMDYILNSPNYIITSNSRIKLYKICLEEK